MNHSRQRLASVSLLALFFVSIVASIPNVSALSPITFTSKATINSVNSPFQQVYENGTSSVVTLDGSPTNGTYYKNTYNVAAGTAASATTTLSGSGNTINSAAYASPVDLSRYSGNFNGVSSLATTGITTDYSTLTISLRIKPSTSLNFPTVFAKADGTGDGIYLQQTTNKIFFQSNGAVVSSTALTLNSWNYVTFVVSGASVTIYINGIQDATGSLTARFTTAAQWQLGYSTGGTYYTGSLDDVGLYNVGLSSSDIQNLANGQLVTGGLVAFYDFNDGIGTSITDLSGNGHTGTLTNVSWDSSTATNSLSRPTTYITGRDTTTGKNGYAKINLSDLSKVSDNYQTSSYAPKGIAQSTTKLYSPLYNASSQYGVLKLGQINRDFTSYSEPTLVTGNSTVPVFTTLANQDTGSGVNGIGGGLSATVGTEKFLSTATMVGKTIDSMMLGLSKNNNPTGTATIGTFDNSGNVVTTFATLDVSTLTASEASYYFTLAKPYVVQANDRIGIKYTGGDASNYINFYTAADVYDGTNAFTSKFGGGSWTDSVANDNRFAMRFSNVKLAVIDGSPDTEYVAFESGTNTIRVAKYASSASLLGTALTHTSGQPFSIAQLSGKIIIQTANATYSLNTSTDAITTLYSTSFNTRYPQTFTISPSARTYNSNAAYLANSTIAVNYTPSTGSSASTGVMIQTTTAPTLTAYSPSKYYYLTQNQLVVANSGSGNTWTISTVGSQNQFHVTPYSEHLSINLTQNSTLFGQNVFKLVCGSGEYTDNIPYFATGDYSDCTEWRILPSSSDTVGREIFIPFTTSPDLVHTSPMTAYTFTINSSTPTYYYIKSSYDGKVVDVATFDSSGQAQQRYLYGNCYTVSVTNTNSGQTALAGNICAGDSTTKPIDVNAVSVPVNWQGSSWAYNTYRNYTTPSSNTVTFTVDKNEHPWNASIHVVDNQFSTPTYDQWFNYTGQNAAQTITINGINGNQTLYFDGYENGIPVFNTVVSGQGFNLSGLGFTSLGSIFGIPIAGMFVIVIGGVFTRSSATFGFIAVLATIGVMVAFGLLNINPAFWAAMMGMAAVGIFAYKRLT